MKHVVLNMFTITKPAKCKSYYLEKKRGRESKKTYPKWTTHSLEGFQNKTRGFWRTKKNKKNEDGIPVTPFIISEGRLKMC